METPSEVLRKFTSRHGFDKRVVSDGTPMMYGLVRSYDPSSETFSERWSVIGTNQDTYACLEGGFGVLMEKLSDSVRDFAPTVEQFSEVLSVAMVTYGKAKQMTDDLHARLLNVDANEAQNIAFELAQDVDNSFDVRVIVLCNLSGFVVETVISDRAGVEVERSCDEQLVSSTEELRFAGRLDYAMVRGFMISLFWYEVATETGKVDPGTICRRAIETEFPFREELVRSLLFTICSTATLTDEFSMNIVRMFEASQNGDDE